MATSDLELVGEDSVELGAAPPTAHPGGSGARRMWGLVGQYALLVLLSLVVLGPLLLTVRQALSPPFIWVRMGAPWHPVLIEWKDRTWWSGGTLSVVARTLVVLALLAWMQRVATGRSWRQLLAPSSRRALVGVLVGAVLGTVVLGVATSAVFGSFHSADGRTEGLFALAVVAVAVTQLPGYLQGRHPAVGTLMAAAVALLVVGAVVLFVGPEVWTASWSRYDLGDAMLRSLFMAVLITVFQVTTSIMAAYAFVFLDFPFKRLLFAVIMATLLLPLEVTLVGNIATIRQLEWIDTMQALVLPFAASALGTFLIRQGFRGLPSEIRDATRLDGYGHLAFLTKFAVPLTRPVIASFTVISALQAWNQYLWPRSVIETNSANTLQIQLRAVSSGQVANANEAVAAALVAAVPVVILLVAFQRQIIRGLTAGAVK